MSDWYLENFVAAIKTVDAAIHEYVQRWPQIAPLFWEIVDYHFGWSDGSGIKATGKKVRPLLAMGVGQAIAGKFEQVMPAAVALEMIHNFTLMHDDVMDESLERRHRPTIWSKWNTSQAINAGDGLFTLGMLAPLELLAEDVPPHKAMDVQRVILKACLATVEGQMLDVGFEERDEVAVDEYVTMIRGKSAMLIAAAAETGAILSTDDANVIKHYATFGENLGIAFQIWDDYLGIWGEEAVLGKSAESDILGKKKSYPILCAFEDDRTHAEMFDIYTKPTLDRSDIDAVLALLDQVDAKERTKAFIEEYFGKSMAALDATGIENEHQQRLRDFAGFFVARDY